MEITIEKLYRIIGSLYTEIILLQEKVTVMENIIKQYKAVEAEKADDT